MPSRTSARKSPAAMAPGKPSPVAGEWVPVGELVPESRMVGWEMMLNMEVTGRVETGAPVCEVSNGGLSGALDCLEGGDDTVGEAVGMAEGSSACGVATSEAGWLLAALSSGPPRCSSSSSLIKPRILRTMFPMTSSLGLA
jgi:hypothetical protein